MGASSFVLPGASGVVESNMEPYAPPNTTLSMSFILCINNNVAVIDIACYSVSHNTTLGTIGMSLLFCLLFSIH